MPGRTGGTRNGRQPAPRRVTRLLPSLAVVAAVARLAAGSPTPAAVSGAAAAARVGGEGGGDGGGGPAPSIVNRLWPAAAAAEALGRPRRPARVAFPPRGVAALAAAVRDRVTASLSIWDGTYQQASATDTSCPDSVAIANGGVLGSDDVRQLRIGALIVNGAACSGGGGDVPLVSGSSLTRQLAENADTVVLAAFAEVSADDSGRAVGVFQSDTVCGQLNIPDGTGMLFVRAPKNDDGLTESAKGVVNGVNFGEPALTLVTGSQVCVYMSPHGSTRRRWVIVGASVGVVVVLLLIAIVVVVCYWRRQRRK